MFTKLITIFLISIILVYRITEPFIFPMFINPFCQKLLSHVQHELALMHLEALSSCPAAWGKLPPDYTLCSQAFREG